MACVGHVFRDGFDRVEALLGIGVVTIIECYDDYTMVLVW